MMIQVGGCCNVHISSSLTLYKGGVCGDEVVEYRNKSILTTIEGYITRSMSMIIDHLTKILFIKDDNILSNTTMMVTDCCKTKTSSSSSRSDAVVVNLLYDTIHNFL